MRSLWSTHAGASFRPTAFALDAAVFDLAYITGPVLASALATGIAPAAALGLMLALTGVAVAVIGRQARGPGAPRPGGQGPRPRAARVRSRPLRSGRLLDLVIAAALVDAAISPTKVALIACVRASHALWAPARCWPGYRSAASWAACCSAPRSRGPCRGTGGGAIGPAAGLLRLRVALLTVAGLYPLLPRWPPRWPGCA